MVKLKANSCFINAAADKPNRQRWVVKINHRSEEQKHISGYMLRRKKEEGGFFSPDLSTPYPAPFKTKITTEHAWILSKLQKSMSCDICHSLCENIHTFTTSPQYLAADCVHVWNRHVRCNYSMWVCPPQTGRTHAVARCWQTWFAYWPSELWLLLYIFLSTYSVIYVFICTFKVQSLCCVRQIITSNTLSSL